MAEPVRAYGPTTKEVLLEALAALRVADEVALETGMEGDHFVFADAVEMLEAELKRWEVPHYPLFGRLIAPIPVEDK